MEEIPDHLDIVLFGRFEHGYKRGEVKLASSIYQRPAYPITDSTNIETLQPCVIAGDLAIVLRELQHIQT